MIDRDELKLFPHFLKPAGAVVAVAGGAGWLLFKNADALAARVPLEKDVLLQLMAYLVALGLFLVAFSREKLEDEHVRQVRNTILRATFKKMITFYLVLQLPAILITREFSFSQFLIVPFFLFYHVLFFHYALLKNPAWVYEAEPDWWGQTLQRNRFIFWFGLALLLLIVLLGTLFLGHN